MTRWKASAIHLGISAAIGAAIVAAMLLVWYPEPLFTAMGGNTVVMILVAVDVVLGPLITLIVFNPKKALTLIRLDLAVIAMVQLAALAYGISVVATARPVYVVFTVDRFDVVAANEIRAGELARVTDDRFKGIPWGKPRTIAVKSPTNPDEQVRVIQSALRGADLQTFPQYYVPYEDLAREALRRSRPLERLRKGHPDAAGDIDATLARLGRTLADTNYLPLKGRARDFSVLLDAKTGAVVGTVKVIPW